MNISFYNLIRNQFISVENTIKYQNQCEFVDELVIKYSFKMMNILIFIVSEAETRGKIWIYKSSIFIGVNLFDIDLNINCLQVEIGLRKQKMTKSWDW